ncbi:hypothetical protein Emtol_0444 [Emticicia oligotrophica DSM 17448]|uniref:Uncharacterized protein n=1 Tax=Emticicia oligotrophica (strain DSM 17448 / CIP 109782 / MTCC 6937 / GPTSA100-15) TaxID=929562 RepID=A0ABM5MWR5_EMTOG|nr:hypothetical protein Emtol_0444 [Emticicia oligotrophica DSM 17448]
MTFEEYLLSKKIDANKFMKSEPERFAEWRRLFAEMHPESFTSQKKFLINPTRRKYLLET